MIDRHGERSAFDAASQSRRGACDPAPETPWRLADAVRALEPPPNGTSVGMAEAATALWTRHLKFDAADPHWPDRDRFVLSADLGWSTTATTLIAALLRLSGHEAAEPDLFRRGLGTAVGMALAERLLAARFGRSLVDHRTWVIATDGDLIEGVSHELASLAGHLRLEKLTILWDDRGGLDQGATGLASSDDVLARFAAYGWAVRRVAAEDGAAITGAMASAVRGRRPTLIACRAGSAEVAARPAPPVVPAELTLAWRAAGGRGASARRAWLKRLARHPLGPEFARVTAGHLPTDIPGVLAELCRDLARASTPSRAANQRVLDALVVAMPELVGGATEPAASTHVRGAACHADSFGGRHIRYGLRDQGMAAAMIGIALHGGLVPYGGTVPPNADLMCPAVRRAAATGCRIIHVMEHGPGPDEARSAEPLAALRAMPNVAVFRPACAAEVAECWALALARDDGPSLLVLGDADPMGVRAPDDEAANRCADGGYIWAESAGPRHATLIATGPEMARALAARTLLLADGIDAAIVSLPCWELFAETSVSYRNHVLGPAPRFGVEAGHGFGWERWLGDDGVFVGAIPAEAIAGAVRRRVAV